MAKNVLIVIGLIVLGVLVFCLCCYKVKLSCKNNLFRECLSCMLNWLCSYQGWEPQIEKNSYFNNIFFYIGNEFSEIELLQRNCQSLSSINIFQVTNLLYQLFTIDSQDSSDMVRAFLCNFSTFDLSSSSGLSCYYWKTFWEASTSEQSSR